VTQNNVGVLGKGCFLFLFLPIAGIGGDYVSNFVGPTARDVFFITMFAGLAIYIVRPRSADVNSKYQIGVGVGLIAALIVGIYLFGPAPTVRADGTVGQSVWTVLFAIAGLALIWSALSLVFGGEQQRGILGSARFGNSADVKALTKNGGDLIIGRASNGKLLRYDGPAHLLTIAPTRSGKGIGTIIPNLLLADRSVICIDPKGENARATGRRRESFGAVYYLDPFNLSGRPSSSYNPLALLRPDSIDLAEDAMTLADALIFDEQVSEAHWNEEAKALVAGIILYTVCHDEPKLRTLATLREYLTLAPEDFEKLLRVMQDSPAAGGLIARAANRFLGKSDREAAGVLSSAQRHTHFLDSPRIVKVTNHSDFSFTDLKNKVASVFLILPPDRLDTYARWLRLLLAQSLSEMARSPAKPERPVLFLLDEFAALGKLQPVERAMGLMAGYGLQLWPILQDFHQLRSLYAERAGTFLSNAGVLQAFGVNDYETAEMLSKTMGKTTIQYETQGESRGANLFDYDRSISTTQHIAARNLMDPNEIMKLEPRDMLLMMVGKNPLILRKIRYFEEREFTGLYDGA
jgi:type IV secretion system protein VirD4